MKRLNLILSIVVALTLPILISGCSDKNYYEGSKGGNTGGTLDPADVSFETTHQITCDLSSADASDGFAVAYSLYDENPLDENGALRDNVSEIDAGIYVAGKTKLQPVIPSYVTEVYLYTASLFFPRLMKATISGDVANFERVDITPEHADTRIATRNKDANFKISKYLSKEGKSKYRVLNGNFNIQEDFRIELPLHLKSAINANFPEREKALEKYINDRTFRADKNGEVYATVVTSGATARMVLSYFVLDKDFDCAHKTPQEIKDAATLINLYVYASAINNPMAHPEKGIASGQYVQLMYPEKDKNGNIELKEKFPEGAQLVFVLHALGYGWPIYDGTPGSYSISDSSIKFYSISALNTDMSYGSSNRTVSFSYDHIWTADEAEKYADTPFAPVAGEKYTFTCIGFEDATAYSDWDYNDAVFHVYGVTSSTPIIDGKKIEKTSTAKGLLMFEDNWPAVGDFDLNDIMIEYKTNITYNKYVSIEALNSLDNVNQNSEGVFVTNITTIYTLCHNGGTFKNGFSVEMGIDPKYVKSVIVDGKDVTAAYAATQCIDVFPNAAQYLNYQQTGAQNFEVSIDFVNDCMEKDGVVENGDVNTFITLFRAKKQLVVPFNPFIIPENSHIITAEGKRIEVHLTGKSMTSLGDESLNRYNNGAGYASVWSEENQTYYPFALHLPNVLLSDFKNGEAPKECVPIQQCFSKYTSWVMGGCNYIGRDWYKCD